MLSKIRTRTTGLAIVRRGGAGEMVSTATAAGGTVWYPCTDGMLPSRVLAASASHSTALFSRSGPALRSRTFRSSPIRASVCQE